MRSIRGQLSKKELNSNLIVFFMQVIMMVLPLLFLVVMPKLLQASDPDTQKVRYCLFI